MTMDLSVKKLIILLILNISSVSVQCQDEDDTNHQNYDIIRTLQKSAEDINLSQNLKLISEEDKQFMNAFQDFFPKSIDQILYGMLSETSFDKCKNDLNYVLENLLPPANWSLKMVDSFGKPETGILMGNVKWLGMYDECLKVYAPPQGETGIGDFHGKYCTLTIPLKFGETTLPLSTGVCIPDSCNPNATFNGDSTIFNQTGMNALLGSMLSNSTIACKDRSRELPAGAIVVIVFLSLIVLLAFIGSSITVLEHYMKRKAVNESSCALNAVGDVENASNGGASMIGANNEVILPAWLEKSNAFFNCFCIFTNGEKLLNISSAEGQLPCLHGIRFFSMAWVILCHGFMGFYSSVNNPLEAVDYIDNLPFQVVLNGFFSVDSFFVLSGFLVGYVYFKQAAKTDGKIPWLYFYLHRYIRLTPVYMMVLAFFATVGPFLGSGPLWADGEDAKPCQGYWWMNLLYINNFQTQEEECMGWSWYLANDMQFYILCPLFLITLYRWPKIGYSLFGLFFSICFTTNFWITYKYDLVPGLGNMLQYGQDFQTFLPKLGQFMNKIYIKPYNRIGAYLVGLLLAYIIYKRKQNNSGKLSTIQLWVGWMLGTGITLACQFGLYHQKSSTLGASFYNALSRIGFSLGLGWVIFVCVIGQGDAVNSILGWKPLIPISRLTYCAYLVHPIVQTTYLLSLKRLLDFSHINAVIFFLGTLFISYFAAFWTSLLLESPVIRLERLLRNKLASKMN